MQKLKAGIFDGPQIRELIKDPMFDEAPGSYCSLKNFCQLGVGMSVKLHFLRSHLVYFSKNCKDLS